MKNRSLPYCLILIELVIQVVGSIYYYQTPGIVWTLSNGILFVMAIYGEEALYRCLRVILLGGA